MTVPERDYFEMLVGREVRRLEDLVAAEKELRRARREDDLLAIAKSEQAIGARLEAMNEFRSQLQEERATYVTREFADEQIAHREEQREQDRLRMDKLEGWQMKMIGALGLVGFVLPVAVGLVVYLLTRHAIPTH